MGYSALPLTPLKHSLNVRRRTFRMPTSYLLLDSTDPSAEAWVDGCIRGQLLAFEKCMICVILEEESWQVRHYKVRKRIALKLSGVRDFHSLSGEVAELAGEVPATGSLVFVPQAVELTPQIRDVDVDVSYYSVGVADRMITPRNTNARILHKSTGLIARSDTHRRSEENRVEAMLFLTALLLGRASGEQLVLGNPQPTRAQQL